MFSKMMRRCFAASVIAMSAGVVSAGSAWAGTKHVQIVLGTPLDEDGEVISRNHNQGIGYGDKLVVEFWEHNGSSFVKNDACSFHVVVSGNGVMYATTADYSGRQNNSSPLDVSVEYLTDGAPSRWAYKLSEGCDPGDAGRNIDDERTHFRIYGDSSYVSANHNPIVVHEVRFQSEKSDGSRVSRQYFSIASVGNWGSDDPYSKDNACAEEQYVANYGSYDADFEFLDGDDFWVKQIDINKKDDDGDILGAVIFPNARRTFNIAQTMSVATYNALDEEDQEDVTRYSGPHGEPGRYIIGKNKARAGLTFCGGGYWPDQNESVNMPSGFDPRTPVNVSALPGHNSVYGSNLTGNGLVALASHLGDVAPTADTLSVLTWNVGSIPDTPDKTIEFVSCALADANCNAQWRARRRILQEMTRYISIARPDVLVIVEAFQDKGTFGGSHNYNLDKARDKFKSELEEQYEFAVVMPTDQPSNSDSRPDLCPSGAEGHSEIDQTIYPDATEDPSSNTHCMNPKGTGLDSGVLIGVRKSPYPQSYTLEIVDGQSWGTNPGSSDDPLGNYWTRYSHAAGVEGGAAKGLRYVKVRKTGLGGSHDYHIFGTHLQSSKNECEARVNQLLELTSFLTDGESWTPRFSVDDKILLFGDLNIDPWRNNHVTNNVSVDEDGNITIGDRAEYCRNELEYLVQKTRYFMEFHNTEDREYAGRIPLTEWSLPFTNDCVLNREVGDPAKPETCGTFEAPGDKSKILDHGIWVGAKPDQMGSSIVRQVSNGVSGNFFPGQDLSGHFPTLTVVSYDDADWGGLVLDSRYTFPMMCPYGTPVGVEGSSTHSFGATEVIDGSVDLACVPVDCESTDTSDRCNAVKIAGMGADRKYCLSGEENWTAPCIVQPGYQNLAAADGVVTDASSVLGNRDDKYGSDRVIDGKMRSKDEWAFASGTSWAAQAPLADGESDWVRVTLPIPQYVKRVRVRHSGAQRSKGPGLTYSLYYYDTVAAEAGTCSPRSDP
ncbi:MAG: hypothetical protein AAFY56_12865, partial [Pseudomonadota bacterium]